MPKTKISEFSATPASNTDIDSINIAEGCAPSGINDAIRELMAQLKDFQTGAVGDSFNGPVGTTTAAAGAFTTLSSTGNTTLGDASGDSVTINGTATFANANPTLSAGTANGVAYLNGSKVVTSGSALTFDGTNLGIAASSPTAKLHIGGSTASTQQAIFSTGVTDSDFKVVARNGVSGATAVQGYIGLDYANGTWPLLAGMQFIRNSTSGELAFTAGATTSASEQMRLTSTGLGIGTSSPGQRLDVNGSIRSRDGAFIASIGTSTKGLFCTYNQIFGSGSDYTPVIFAETGLGITFAVNGTSTKAMTLDTNNNLLVGLTSLIGSGRTEINATSTNPALCLRTPQSSGTVSVQIFFDGDNTDCGSIDVNTTANTTAYTTSSDYRLKENVVSMTGALATVGQLNPVTWNWKHAPEITGQGFIAHELQAIIPDAVVGEKDAVDENGNIKAQGIDTSFLVATLTAALQELNAKFDAYVASHP